MVKQVILIICAILAVVAVALLLGFGDIWFTKTYGVAKADANRQVYEQSSSYVLGKTQELTRMRHEYSTAKTDQDKEAMRQLIIDTASTVDNSKLPTELRSFVESVKYEVKL